MKKMMLFVVLFAAVMAAEDETDGRWPTMATDPADEASVQITET